MLIPSHFSVPNLCAGSCKEITLIDGGWASGLVAGSSTILVKPYMYTLFSEFHPAGDQQQAIEKILDGLWQGFSHITLLGVTGAGKTYTIANVIAQLKRPTIILAPNKTLAAQLYGEMKTFFPKSSVEYFVSYYDYYQPEAYMPSSDTFIEKDASINEHIEQMRLSATKALFDRQDPIIVGTVSSIYGLGDPRLYLGMVLHIDQGDNVQQRDILRRLTELQYVRNNYELKRGTFRVVGDVIDVYCADSDREAVRLELFDNTIQRISFFDPLTHETLGCVPRATIYPKTHYATPRSTVIKTIELVKEELELRLRDLRQQDKLVEAQRLEQRTRYDLEMLREVGYCAGIENYSRYLSGRKAGEPPPCLMDYLPENALMVMDESHVSVPQFMGMYKGDHARKKVLVEHGFRLPSALDNRPLKFEEFENIAPQTIYVSATPSAYERQHSTVVVEQIVRPTGLLDPPIEIRPASRQVDDVLGEIRKLTERSERVLITTLTKRMSEDLAEYLNEHGVRVRYLHSDIDTVERVEIIRDLRLGKFDVLIGINLLREGLDIPEVSLVAIFDADKQGFLRSCSALVQTVGRAARHIHGRAIMYAEKITNAMQAAIDETERRRKKQIEYNATHGVVPKGISKSVKDIMAGAHVRKNGRTNKRGMTVASDISLGNYPTNIYDAGILIENLEKKMYRYARDLRFEDAVRLRDHIKQIKNEFYCKGKA